MDHNCPVCKTNLKWEFPPARMKLKKWQLTYRKKCSKCGSEFEWNTHINELKSHKAFLPFWMLLLTDLISKSLFGNIGYFKLRLFLIISVFIISFVVSHRISKGIPRNWPRWKLTDSST